MLEYLEQLVKEQKWEEALVIAEQLLLDRENSVEDQFRINMVLITARAFLGEYAGVVLLGDHVARMATDFEDWDAYLTTCHYLGYAFSVLGQWSEAKRVWHDFIERVSIIGHGHLFEVMTWFHLGVASEVEGDLDAAVSYFLQARRLAASKGDGRQVLGVNHALITAYTKQGQYESVPRLLAQGACYLRNNRHAAQWDKAWLHHLQVRATFALTTGRYHRAKLIATRALTLPSIEAIHQFHMHMILAKVARNLGNSGEMIENYLRARVAAIRARRYDFEVDAAESLYVFVQSNQNSMSTPLGDVSIDDLPAGWFEMDDILSRRS